MSASAEIIDKIRKLLRLARSSNPHEAALAMQRAMELAAEHRVSIEGLNPDESVKEKKVTHQDGDPLARMNYDKRYAIVIVKLFFRVTVVECSCVRMVHGWPENGVKLMFVGSESDIEIGRYVYGFLVNHFAHCWNHRENKRLRDRQSFVYWMLQGLMAKLKAGRPEVENKGTEIVLAEHRTYIGSVIGATTSASLHEANSTSSAAGIAGWLQGKKTEILGGLRPAPAGPLQLA